MFLIMQPLINSPTRHYNNTGKHSPSLQLAFLTSVQQEGDLKYVCVVLNGMSIRIATPIGNILEATKVGTPLYLGHLAPMVFTL